jgi:hypothetical protein
MRTQVALEHEDRGEDRGDDQYFLNAAAFDARLHDKDQENEQEHRAGPDDERTAAIHR